MKKEYKAPILSVIKVEVESPMMDGSQGEWVESKKSGRTFEDDEAMPAAPKKFWDDEE